MGNNKDISILYHISNNLKKIRNKITASEKKFLRGENSVCLIAVSKTRKINEIISAIDENQHHFGENYCQEGVEKIKAVTKPGIVWHFIGPVQSKKTSKLGSCNNIIFLSLSNMNSDANKNIIMLGINLESQLLSIKNL